VGSRQQKLQHSEAAGLFFLGWGVICGFSPSAVYPFIRGLAQVAFLLAAFLFLAFAVFLLAALCAGQSTLLKRDIRTRTGGT
jgi:hypothetical protein